MSHLAEISERTAPRNHDHSSTAVKERRAILRRVLWSRQFEKYGRIREFLEYVCERSLDEPSVEIHEQEIGYRVFGRNKDYDTSADNIVRVTASQARKKLEQYFGSEGSAEPIVFEIPKGQYTPLFRERESAAVLAVTTDAQKEGAHRSLAWYRGLTIALAITAFGLGTATIVLGRKLHTERLDALSPIYEQPSLRALWSQLFPTIGRTDIVVTDSSLSLFEELLDRQLTLPEYLNQDQWLLPDELSSDPKLRAFADIAAKRGFTSMASVTAVSRITQLAGRNENLVSILRARNLNMSQMKFDNVILLGSSRANPWIYLLEDRLNFRFGYDQKTRYSYFENRNPRAGEAQFYRMDAGVSYCRIAFLANFAGTGNILSIAGTEIEGTEGGSEFITSERSVSKLMSMLGVAQGKPMPHFEALLKSGRIDGQTEGLSVVAYRILKP